MDDGIGLFENYGFIDDSCNGIKKAIPIGIAMDLNPIGVYLASVVGSTVVAITLVLTFRHIMDFLRQRGAFLGLIKKLIKNRQRNEKNEECFYYRDNFICRNTPSNYRNLDRISYSIYITYEVKVRTFRGGNRKYDVRSYSLFTIISYHLTRAINCIQIRNFFI